MVSAEVQPPGIPSAGGGAQGPDPTLPGSGEFPPTTLNARSFQGRFGGDSGLWCQMNWGGVLAPPFPARGVQISLLPDSEPLLRNGEAGGVAQW